MDLFLEIAHASHYTSAAQRIRVLSEHWASHHIYCPNCGHQPLRRYPNNNPAADFFCRCCCEDFELKSSKRAVYTRVADGAYRTMIDRVLSSRNPNLLLLNYSEAPLSVVNLQVIPKHFLTPEIIQRRKALSKSARRSGWIGCNILLQGIPDSGRIFFVRDTAIVPKKKVMASWKHTLFIRDQKGPEGKSWLLHVMRCIERLQQRTFSLDQMYDFEDELQSSFPENRHIKAKIRQQLQILRDNHYLEFIGRGRYCLTGD